MIVHGDNTGSIFVTLDCEAYCPVWISWHIFCLGRRNGVSEHQHILRFLIARFRINLVRYRHPEIRSKSKLECGNKSFCMLNILAADGIPDSKVPGANMGPIWGRQGPSGPHVGPMNFAIWVYGTADSIASKGYCKRKFILNLHFINFFISKLCCMPVIVMTNHGSCSHKTFAYILIYMCGGIVMTTSNLGVIC